MNGKIKFEKVGSIADWYLNKRLKLDTDWRTFLNLPAEKTSKMKSGLDDFDDLLGSFQPKNLYVIAARPGCFKTTLMLNIALNIASSEDKPVYIFSLDESKENLIKELIMIMSGVHSMFYNDELLDGYERGLLGLALESLESLPIYICATARSFDEIKNTIKSEVKDGIVFIDYVQMLSTKDERGYRYIDYETEKEISLELKKAAVEFNLPIVALSQVSRKVEERKNHRPKLKDLHISSKLAQVADTVAFIYWDYIYNKDANNEIVELIVDKNSNKKTGTVMVKIDTTKLRFENLKWD